MRPKKLVLAGFGTYLKPTVIDFDKLGTSGLYIVTGDTGAGKTTIFDAITYALYGEASGELRETSMLRTDFATQDDPTYVELTFEYRGKEYFIKRNPSYIRRDKKNKEKTATENQYVELRLPDGKIVTNSKGSSVNDEVEKILGLKKDQFRQIVMIAQGEFQKLIKQETKDRIQTFRSLFNTEKYDLLLSKLKESYDSLKKQVDKDSDSLKQYFNGAICEENNPSFEELENLKETDVLWETKASLLDKLIKEDIVQEKILNESIDKNQKELDELNEKLGIAEQLVQNTALLVEKRKKVDDLNLSLEEFKEVLNKASDEKKNSKKIEEKVAVLNNTLNDYEILEILCKEITDFTEKESNLKKTIIQLQSRKDENNTKLQNMRNNFDKLKSIEEDSAKLQIELNSKQEDYSKVKNLLKSDKDLILNFNSVLEKQKAFQTFYENTQNAKNEFEEKNKLYLFEQAGILAETLEENKPCPVCGSHSHPAPAKKSENAPSKEELELLKEQVSTLESECNKKSQDCSAKKAAFQETFKNFTIALETVTELNFKSEISDFNSVAEKNETLEILETVEEKLNCKMEILETSIRTLKLQSEEINKNIQKKQMLEQEIPDLETKIAKDSNEIANISAEISGISATLTEKNNRRDELKSNLEYETKQKAMEKISLFNNQLFQLNKNYEKAELNFNQCKDFINSLNGQISQLEESLKTSENFNFEKLQSDKKQKEIKRDELAGIRQKVVGRININQQILDKINEKSKNLEEKEEKTKYVLELYKTAAGTVGNGVAKIKLETYIQMAYFDRIIAFANSRYLIMTDRQYEMERDVSQNSQSQGGLEINIVDHNNNTKRSIKSLSGGEQFQASLALALGLSDEIAQSAGGIQLDSLFVDEGFGTLDDETARKAYRALSTIAKNNRLVGLISHIDLLKTQIDKQIVVTKKVNEGSSVELRV